MNLPKEMINIICDYSDSIDLFEIDSIIGDINCTIYNKIDDKIDEVVRYIRVKFETNSIDIYYDLYSDNKHRCESNIDLRYGRIDEVSERLCNILHKKLNLKMSPQMLYKILDQILDNLDGLEILMFD
jgi:hypothetical protein